MIFFNSERGTTKTRGCSELTEGAGLAINGLHPVSNPYEVRRRLVGDVFLNNWRSQSHTLVLPEMTQGGTTVNW